MKRQLQPPVFRIKRDVEQTLVLASATAPEGWTRESDSMIYKTFGWSLGSAPLQTEFQDLFRQYRIKGARVRMYFSNTQSANDGTDGYANSQLLVRMAPNNTGATPNLSAQYWQQLSGKKYKTALNGGKPLDIYMPLGQPNVLQSSTGATAPSLTKPKWIMTSVANIVHYGINMSIERVDGQPFTTGHNNNQRVRLIETLYFEFKGTQ